VRQLVASGEMRARLDAIAAKLPVDGARLDGIETRLAATPQGINRLWHLHVLGPWAGRWL
jgi:hypothetical protein